MLTKGWVVVVTLAALGATALIVPEVQAGKPGGGGGATLDGGRIWYYSMSRSGDTRTVKSVLPSGSGVQSYPGLDFLGAEYAWDYTDLSRGTHGGKRWLVVHRASAPAGLLLVSEDGALQASFSCDTGPGPGQARLRPHPATGAPDASITWHGTTSAGTIGTYEAAIDWSTSPPTLAGATLLFDTGLAIAGYHDWSSDGRTIVYHGSVPVGSGTEFHLLRRTSSDSFAVAADLGAGGQPRVSSGASARIMFVVTGVSGLWTTPLDGDGSSRSQLPLPSGAWSDHLWSPNATSFAYHYMSTKGTSHTYTSVLTNVDGSASRDLSSAIVVGWVE